MTGVTSTAATRGTVVQVMVLLATLSLLLSAMAVGAPPVAANHTAAPSSVTIAGSLQSEIGCAGDWDPGCATSHLALDAADDAWQATFDVPAGSWEYKAALNEGWDENYGANAAPNGSNIELNLAEASAVTFYYSHATHWVTDNVTSVIATAAGSFQSELGCPGDWQPECLRSWLQDPDGDGIHTFVTTALPAGSYEAKAAINESWDENYGAGGVPDGDNIPFTVPVANAEVTFSYDTTTHVLAITAGGGQDGNVEWDGLRHDSRDLLYRTPGGAQPAGTPITLRFRTFAGDVTGVSVRWYSLEQGGQQITPMEVAAAGIGCYEDGLEDRQCDFWQTTLPADWGEDNLWYRFIVSDGADTDYYADDTAALDGGLGSASDQVEDRSWALMLHVPGFEAPDWAADAVIYQIFPDRFRNGRSNNDPETNDVRYDDPVIKLDWGTKPEGYCRNYADAATTCPWRFDATPPPDSPTREQPRGRDYFGGDLKGVEQRLDELDALGVTTIYFNPIFDAGSNHGYDTQDYTRIDPYFGTKKDWDNLVAAADARGMRIILDGVFNHLSSDSPFFDRYHHYQADGACESLDSPYRDWFYFTPDPDGPCVGEDGGRASYEAWFGFDSIPVINKSLAEVQAYFLTDDDSITRRWLEDGASGWRLDVSGDPSFPDGYWETFRDVVKQTDPDALTISETWQKDSTLLREIRGDRLDTTMNYRLRDAVLGLLAPQGFDSKGFADSGYQISPTQFVNRIASVREDYPDAAYYSLMNLLDSHDTERLLWTLTPGAETTAEKELDAANVAAGKARQRIAALIQFTMPGAPTVFYGDEVGITGDDDPDDRRTYPWPGAARRGDSRDLSLLAHYTSLAAAREENDALTDGDIRILFADDGAGTLAYGRTTDAEAAVVAVNRSDTARTLDIPVAGYLPDGVTLTASAVANAPAGGSATVAGGMLSVELPALSAIVLGATGLDLAAPSAPTDLVVTGEASNQVSLGWSAVAGAAGYDVYVSPLSGGGYERANTAPVTATELTVEGLENGREYFFVVRALDAAGNASGPSNEVAGIPHLAIGWANLQWPPSMTHVISATDRTDDVYGQVWIDGVTSNPGATPSLRAQLGLGPDGSDPASGASGWEWVEAAFNTDAGNNDEFVASLQPDRVGTFDYAYRYTVTGGRDWVYADLDGIGNGYSTAQAGSLAVVASGDTTAPGAPAGLVVLAASPGGVTLRWDAVDDPTLHGYEIGRADASGGPFAVIGTVTAPSTEFTDSAVVESRTYWYVVRAVDTSFNRSAWSDEVSATTELRSVSLTFEVTVPATTDGVGLDVNIAGFLDRLDGGHPQWDPTETALTRVDAIHWTITFTGLEGTALEYKYALDDPTPWLRVEKDATCDEIQDRQLTLAYGTDGNQVVADTVLNWRNVAPCGD